MDDFFNLSGISAQDEVQNIEDSMVLLNSHDEDDEPQPEKDVLNKSDGDAGVHNHLIIKDDNDVVGEEHQREEAVHEEQ